ncbi:MAG: class I SAM-dependent DNA methyltransferase, partial [Janthinobacterium lividum]
DRKERGRLGAEFTPRPFVERLVLPAVMEPLREEWDGVRAAAEAAMQADDPPAAAALVRGFHATLCAVRVLDPACGTGNFLYVTLELMKRLEGEVLDTLAGYARGDAGLLDLAGATVDPHQFLGLDVNPRAVPVAELVLWIGYLQWHFRTNGAAPPAEPILRDFRNIREADALLSYTRTEADKDSGGRTVTRWGGRTVPHPITGEDVPDLTDRVVVLRPVGGKQAPWPAADFIVGNPPFVAAQYMREKLGGGYAETLWAAYPKVPPSADLAMFFWWRAAEAARAGKARRFGFITSNSVHQVFSRRVIAAAMEGKAPLHLAFAIPDHPWAQGTTTAAVRIAMTVGAPGIGAGRLLTVEQEGTGAAPDVVLTERQGMVNADLTMGVSPSAARPLRANERISGRGMSLHGAGFIVSPATAAGLGLGRVPGLEQHIRPYANGRDITAHSRGRMVIDLFGLTEAEVRQRFPAVFQHLLLHVKPERDQNNREAYRAAWWVFGEPRRDLRPALHGLPRFIVTLFAAKHRLFVLQDASVLPDNMLVCVASDDAWHLGILNSRFHVAWILATGGTLEDRPLYSKTACFDPFPFPAATPAQAAEIGALAEELDALRKARLAAHPHLTLTGLYNVLAAIRAGQPLTPADRDVLDAGHVEVLRHLHDRLDAAVAAAYGWPADLPAAAIVERVVALNRERVAEEAAGHVRWLRPAYQAPAEVAQAARKEQLAMAMEADAALPTWPKAPGAQYVALRAALARIGHAGPSDLARQFRGVRPAKLAPMLEVLAAIGQARDAGGGRYVA